MVLLDGTDSTVTTMNGKRTKGVGSLIVTMIGLLTVSDRTLRRRRADDIDRMDLFQEFSEKKFS